MRKLAFVPGARQISSGAAACRMNAAFRLASARRIYAAAKNFVVRPFALRGEIDACEPSPGRYHSLGVLIKPRKAS
jgi:hypothetical protein